MKYIAFIAVCVIGGILFLILSALGVNFPGRSFCIGMVSAIIVILLEPFMADYWENTKRFLKFKEPKG